jgi:hypothetical protein
MEFFMRVSPIYGRSSVIPIVTGSLVADTVARGSSVTKSEMGEKRMAGLVDILIPANGQAAAEALGLKVHRSVTAGARIRQIPPDEAEIAVECLRDWGIFARVVEVPSQDQPAPERGATPAA